MAAHWQKIWHNLADFGAAQSDPTCLPSGNHRQTLKQALRRTPRFASTAFWVKAAMAGVPSAENGAEKNKNGLDP